MNNHIENKLSKGALVFFSLFLFAGLGALYVAGNLALERAALEKNGLLVQGQVVRLLSSRGSGDNANNNVYNPVISFEASGRLYEFAHDVSSYPPAFDVGERVEVIYLPDSPEKASINSFWSFWGPPIFLGLGALVFCLLGGGLMYVTIATWQQRKRLIESGYRIAANFDCVDRTQNSKTRDYWTVRASWQNPADGKMYLFESDALFYNPESLFATNKQIAVLIDVNNPKKYMMDLASLPKTA